MLAARCVMLWSVCAAILLCVPVWSDAEMIQPYRVQSTNGTVQVQCSVQTPSSFYAGQRTKDGGSLFLDYEHEELRVNLLKGLQGSKLLCSTMVRTSEQRAAGVEDEGQVQCSAEAREGAMEVTVSGLRAADTDIYRCEIEVFYPPPYRKLTGNGTLIHVLESSDCPVVAAERQTSRRAGGHMDEEEEEEEERTSPVSVPVLVLVILVSVALLFIMYLQALQCSQGRREMVRAAAVLYNEDAACSC